MASVGLQAVDLGLINNLVRAPVDYSDPAVSVLTNISSFLVAPVLHSETTCLNKNESWRSCSAHSLEGRSKNAVIILNTESKP